MLNLRAWKCFSVAMAVVLILGVAAIALPAATARAQEATWELQTINDSDAVCTSIALDSQGLPHIAYCTGGLFSVHYSSWTGTSWVTELVDDVPALVVSLALDSQDNPHIAYSTSTPSSLHYASKVGTAWTIETADPCNVSDCSLALDSQNWPHICYINSDFIGVPGPLRYVYLTDTGWENNNPGCVIAASCSLALGGGDLPHIAYTTGLPTSVHYTHLVGGSWIDELVSDSPGRGISIALDSHGGPHIAYTTLELDSLHYASRTGGVWTTQTVDPANASDCSLAMDSQDNPHISYYVGNVIGSLAAGGEEESVEQGIDGGFTLTGVLEYAAWTGSEWDIQTVDQETVHVGFTGIGSSAFKWCSLALDEDDLPHISYGNMVSFLAGSLHYAHLVMPQEPIITPGQRDYSPPMPNVNRYLNQANMSVQFVSVNPQQAIANQPVTITTNVVNTGDVAGNYNIALKINGQVEESRMVSVGPMASQPVKFTVTRDQPGMYTVDIVDKSSSFTILGDSATGQNSTGLIILALIGVLIVASVVIVLLRRA
jgi:hypothetical protein